MKRIYESAEQTPSPQFGLLEDDGLFIILSYVLAAVCIGFLIALFVII